jgi:hypothetical protein
MVKRPVRGDFHTFPPQQNVSVFNARVGSTACQVADSSMNVPRTYGMCGKKLTQPNLGVRSAPPPCRLRGGWNESPCLRRSPL